MCFDAPKPTLAYKLFSCLHWIKSMELKQNLPFLHRGSYMSAHVLLNLLNELDKERDRGLSSSFILFWQRV